MDRPLNKPVWDYSITLLERAAFPQSNYFTVKSIFGVIPTVAKPDYRCGQAFFSFSSLEHHLYPFLGSKGPDL